MGVATYTENFDTSGDMSSPIVWAGDGGGGAIFDGSDGDPSPGCAENPGFPFGFDNTGINESVRWNISGHTWQDFGVPFGQTVHAARGTCNVKISNGSGTPIANSVTFTIFADPGDLPNPRATLGTVASPAVGSWFSIGGTVQPLSPQTSSTSANVGVTLNYDALAGETFQLRVDSFVIEVYYGTCSLSVSPSSASLTAGGSITFTASGGSIPVTWSATGGSIDSGGNYTAPLTPGSYTVKATSIWDATCFVNVPVTISSPTPHSRSDAAGSARATLVNAGSPIGGGSSIKAHSAGVVAHAVLTAANNACLEVYFAGVDNGDDFTIMAYSAPTELCLLNPVAGHEYILEAPAADLARFLGKRMGNVKFRRAGAGGNYTGAILLRAIELYYKVKT